MTYPATTLEGLADLEALLGPDGRDTLLRMGVTHGERARAALATALAAGDDGTVRREAHGLRGAVTPFGVPALAESLRRLEYGEPVAAAAIDDAIAGFVAACRAASG